MQAAMVRQDPATTRSERSRQPYRKKMPNAFADDTHKIIDLVHSGQDPGYGPRSPSPMDHLAFILDE